MPVVTVFRRKVSISAQKPLSTILKQIKNGMYQSMVESLRLAIAKERKNRANYIQGLIPGFTPSGKYVTARLLSNLEQYTQYIQLETAKLKREQLSIVKSQVTSIPYTYACFVNAPGDRLIILTETPLEGRWHYYSFVSIRAWYADQLNLGFTDQGKSALNVCSYSYDPDIYINPDAAAFPVEPSPGGPKMGVSRLKALCLERLGAILQQEREVSFA